MSKITYTPAELELAKQLVKTLQEQRNAISDERWDELEGTWLMTALDGLADLEYELEN
jgi:hypothetical protein